jgi:hypothetical protein
VAPFERGDPSPNRLVRISRQIDGHANGV